MTEIRMIYSTFPTRAEAISVAGILLTERLIACANLLDNMLSLYRWEGDIRQEPEVAMIAKTTQAKLPQAMARIKELHPYALPCIVAYAASDGLPAFLQWVAEETANP